MQVSTLVGEFANTFAEWHYLVGGFAAGVLVGAWLALRFALAFNGQGDPGRFGARGARSRREENP